MGKALLRIWSFNSGAATQPDWRKAMSDHIARALLVYAALQIFLTMSMASAGGSRLLPYLTLGLLIAGVIPASRALERRWESLTDQEAADPRRAGAFRRDRRLVWIVALGLPFLVVGLYRAALLLA